MKIKNIVALCLVILFSIPVLADCTQIYSTIDPVICEFQTLQVLVGTSTELRTWPGTQFNFQKSYNSWAEADTLLTIDIANASAAWANYQNYNLTEENRNNAHVAIQDNLYNLEKHILDYTKRGYISKNNSKKIISQANKLINMTK